MFNGLLSLLGMLGLKSIKRVFTRLQQTMTKHSKYYYDFDRNMANRTPNLRPLKYFTTKEFDSPDEVGSGEKMSKEFLAILDEARERAGVPFKITSGYRTQAYHNDLTKRGYKTSPTSAHLLGLAADISTPTSTIRFQVIQALLEMKITRIGIGKNFVHCDIKPSSHKVCWTYY